MQKDKKKDEIKKIIFVCTGNTCRSSMAQGLFEAALTDNSRLSDSYAAYSAGIHAAEGDPASPYSIKVLRDWGIDISGHHARRITREDILSSYLVLTMTMTHKNILLAYFPEAAGKTFTLKEFTAGNTAASGENENLNFDIADPFGMPEEEYRKCALDIRQAVDELVKKLMST